MRALRSWRAHRVGLLVIAATVAAVVGAPSTAGAAKKKPRPVILVTIGDQAVYGVADAPPAVPDDVRNNVMRALTGYMTAATVKPLQKGSVDNGALASMFDNSVNARATTSDRGVLVDDGMPKATGRITLTAAPVKLSALVDDRGRVIVVTAALDATTNAKTSKGKVTIHRTGELVFTPDGASWKVSGYDLKVDRIGKPFAPPTPPTTIAATAAAASPGKVAK